MKMKQQTSPAVLAGHLLLVLAHAAHFTGASSLRRHVNIKSSSSQHRTRAFDSLPECEVAYDALEEQCSRGVASSRATAGSSGTTNGTASSGPGGASSATGHGGAHGASGSHGDRQDEEGASYHDGQGIVKTENLNPSPDVYQMPRDKSGDSWDYKLHGDDWTSLGSCAGGQQSPIDLDRYIDVRGQTKYVLWFDYYKDPDLPDAKVASLVNDGHHMLYQVNENEVDLGFVKIGLQEFTATEYEFHAPSEHSMDGAVYPLELQIHNKGDDGKIVAVAIFFREGSSNPFLSGLMESMHGNGPEWSGREGTGRSPINATFPNAFNLEGVIPKGTDGLKEKVFFNYQGSLTSPPCTEGVDWWVLSDPITATRDEIRFARRAIFNTESMNHGNARSTQQLGQRSVFVGITGFQHAVKARIKKWATHDAVQDPRGYTSQDMPWGPHWDSIEEEPELSSAPSPAGYKAPGGAPVPAMPMAPAAV